MPLNMCIVRDAFSQRTPNNKYMIQNNTIQRIHNNAEINTKKKKRETFINNKETDLRLVF